MNEIINQALEKLDKEAENFKGGMYEKELKDYLLKALRCFCESEQEFAQAVVQSDKTLSDCAKVVTSGAKGTLSDEDAYNIAARFYFPGAKVHCPKILDLIGGAAGDTPENGMSGNKKSALNISLDELF